MKKIHKSIILFLLNILLITNVFWSSWYEDCENNLWISKYPNLSSVMYNKVTSLWNKLIEKYSIYNDVIKWEKINSVFLLISNLKKTKILKDPQIEILDLLWNHISCITKNKTIQDTAQEKVTDPAPVTNNYSWYMWVDKIKIEKGELITFSLAKSEAEFSAVWLTRNCNIRDLNWKSLWPVGVSVYWIVQSQKFTATPLTNTTYTLECQPTNTLVRREVERIEVNVNDKELSDMKNSKLDELWDYWFYVIYENNDYDLDGVKEWCNEEWLAYPDTLCILKLWKMYVSPKNFTTSFGIKPIEDTSTVSSGGTFTQTGNNYFKESTGITWISMINWNYIMEWLDQSWLTPYSLKNIRAWAELCSQNWEPFCSNYKIELWTVPSNSFDPNAASCEDLFTFRSWKTLWSKKWSELSILWWDWLNYNCSENSSNKEWRCALQLNKSKLRIMNWVYYWWWNIYSNITSYYWWSYSWWWDTSSAVLLTFWSNNRYTPEVVTNYRSEEYYIARSQPYIKQATWRSILPMIIDWQEVNINYKSWFYQRCVAY